MTSNKRTFMRAAIGVAVLAAFSINVHAADTLKVGLLATLEGPFAVPGQDGIRGAELALKQAVDAAHLLLFAKLLAEVGKPHSALLTVLTGRIAAALDCTLVGETFLAFEEELLPLSTALATLGV